MAKAYLDEHKIAYTGVDVSEDEKAAQEMIQKSGQMGVPVIDIDGEIIVGFDRDAIAKKLGL
jgi:glutaredoxin